MQIKNMKKYLLLLLSATYLISSAQSSILIGNTEVQVDTVASGLDIPWEVIYTQDEHLWLTERKGIVSRIDLNTGTREVLLDLSAMVIQQSESGLLGMALHPDFANTPEVFLAYTYGSNFNIRERIVKYTYQNDSLLNQIILIDEIPGNSTHNGCRLFFLPDTTLLASTGDAQIQSLPQDTSSLNGKILRLNTDGSVPSNNPFPNSYVYSFGHRNVQGIASLPNGSIILSEHGASTDDEVQILQEGGNFGWPNVEGFCNTTGEMNFCNNNNVVEPLLVYTPTIAPSDLVFYTNNNFPEWDNRVLLTVLKDKEIRALQMNTSFDSIVSDFSYLENSYQRLRDIAIGKDGEIFLASSGDSWSNTDPNSHFIVRLSPPPPSTDTSTALLNLNPENFQIFPNPSSDLLWIKNEGNLKLLSAKIFDLQGRLIEVFYNLESNYIDVSKLPKASYIIKLETKNHDFSRLLFVKD